MIDFPASPTVGQIFTSGGQQWMFDGAKWLPAGQINAAVVPMNDNRLINGDMRIDQRNNGASGTASGYTIDRWAYGATQTGKGTWQRQTGSVAIGFPYCLLFSSSSAYASLATDGFSLYQSIEADMVSDFAWGTPQAQPVTLSFWVVSTLTGTFSGAVKNFAGTRSYPFAYSIPAASTWTKIVVAIPGDTAGTWVMSGNAGALQVLFDLGTGSNTRGPANAWAGANYNGVTGTVSVVGTNGATFYLTGVKLEIGSTATPFNRQSLAKSLADCQRYFQRLVGWSGAGYATTSPVVQHWAPISPSMRATPSLTPTWGTNTNLSPTVGASGTGLLVGGNATATGQWGFNLNTCDLSAEL